MLCKNIVDNTINKCGSTAIIRKNLVQVQVRISARQWVGKRMIYACDHLLRSTNINIAKGIIVIILKVETPK